MERKVEQRGLKRTLLWVNANKSPFEGEWALLYSPISLAETEIIWVKSYYEFIGWIEMHGLPTAISIDFHLGDKELTLEREWSKELNTYLPNITYQERTGYTCVIWLTALCKDLNVRLPKYRSQAAIPTQRFLIKNLLDRYERHYTNFKQ